MRFLLFLTLALVAFTNAERINSRNIDDFLAHQSFTSFKATHRKQYASVEEENLRFSYFKETLKRIEINNAKNGEHVFGINKFSDLHPSEFQRMYLNYKPQFGQAAIDRLQRPVTPFKRMGNEVPVSDWRKQGAVTPVKDQGRCGSCWAFSAVEQLESAWYLAGNKLTSLSPQQVVSCDVGGFDQGCNGGDTVTAYTYMQKAGIEGEATYPYTSGTSGSTGQCKFNSGNVVARMSNYTYAIPGCFDSCQKQDEVALAQTIAKNGPASICVSASIWQDYRGGIIRSGCASSYQSLNHCVQVVGVETNAAGDKYWLVRNSWNTNWGEKGYIYLLFGNNACGLADEATFINV